MTEAVLAEAWRSETAVVTARGAARKLHRGVMAKENHPREGRAAVCAVVGWAASPPAGTESGNDHHIAQAVPRRATGHGETEARDESGGDNYSDGRSPRARLIVHELIPDNIRAVPDGAAPPCGGAATVGGSAEARPQGQGCRRNGLARLIAAAVNDTICDDRGCPLRVRRMAVGNAQRTAAR